MAETETQEPYRRFKEAMMESGGRIIRRFTSEDGDVYEGSEIHVWMGRNGHIFLTQPWARGGFEVYYPDPEHRLTESIEKALAYSKPHG